MNMTRSREQYSTPSVTKGMTELIDQNGTEDYKKKKIVEEEEAVEQVRCQS